MRFSLVALFGALLATSGCDYAMVDYNASGPRPVDYVQSPPDGWPDAREEWHRARRGREIAGWRAMNGAYEGADRAAYWAERHRERARREDPIPRGGVW